MIELKHDCLRFSFPEVHEDASFQVDFQRTLRIPDDGKDHALPPGLGAFPLRHVDDFAERVPGAWLKRGGVMLPMYQAEALWLSFGGQYPFAVKIATGKINAVTGEEWTEDLHRRPQDYVTTPRQPWLDGYCVKKGVIRQFVAMPLGSGYSAEEQLTGEAEHGGLQIVAYPMKRKAYERHLGGMRRRRSTEVYSLGLKSVRACAPAPDMGLAPGGRMTQEIYGDPHGLADWDLEHGSRCFVHLTNSLVWEAITKERPPYPPPTAKAYTDAGLPWFDYYGEGPAVSGAGKLAGLLSVSAKGAQKGDAPLPENESVDPKNVIPLRAGLGKDEVREGRF